MESDVITRARKRGARAVAERPARTAFVGVFAAALLAFLGLGAVLPVLPRYVKGPIGADDFAVGVVTGAFALTAVLCRPVAGRVADARGRRTVVVVGALFAALAGVLYFVPAGVPGLLVARFALGAGEGCVFTAGATWTVDLAPPDRRGRAIGLFGLAIWSALALGPLIGEGLLSLGGYDLVWAFAAISPLCGALVARTVPDAHTPPPPGPRPPLIPRAAVRPGAALALANLGYAALAGFLVLHLAARGIGHGAAVFTAFAAAVVIARTVGGRLPDVLGPKRTAVGAACAEAAGLALIGAAHSLPAALAGALIMGLGFSTLYPSLALLVVQRADDRRRGAALGIFTAFFDIGMGLGGPLAGAIAGAAGYGAAFWVAAVAALVTAAVAAGTRSGVPLGGRTRALTGS
jgi:MFS family permease